MTTTSKKVDQFEAVNYVRDLLDNYQGPYDEYSRIIITNDNIDSRRANTGWYRHVNNRHQLFINVPNILKIAEVTKLNKKQTYALLTLCCGHEYRHYLQGKVAYDDERVEGFDQNDAFNDELMMYIRCFYDLYYLKNKNSVKSEIDAELFAIAKGYRYLKGLFPKDDVEKIMSKAIDSYAKIQNSGVIASTLPIGLKKLVDVYDYLLHQLESNNRIANLSKTLLVHNSKLKNIHISYGLNESKLLSSKLMNSYACEKKGEVRDRMVVKGILSSLKYPEESLEEFPRINEKYKNRTL